MRKTIEGRDKGKRQFRMRKLANMMSVAPFAYGLGIKTLVTGSG